jgi:hypothetical protein
MSTKVKRQHYVPRFLLRRFAARTAGTEAFVWQFRREQPPVQVNVVNAGVQKYFYGDEDQTLEQALSAREAKDKEMLDAIERGADLSTLVHEIWQFAWLQFVRTRAIRQRFESTARQAIARTGANPDPRSIRRNVLAELERTIDQRVASLFPSLPLKERWKIRQQMVAKAKATPLDFAAEFKTIIDQVAALDWPAVSERGHIRGVRKVIADGPNVRDTGPPQWRCIRTATEPFILGDCVVVGVSAGQTRLPVSGRQVEALYVPISPSICLVGVGDQPKPLLNVQGINELSASQSLDAMFSSSNGEREASLAPRVGTQELLLTDNALDNIVADSKIGLHKRKQHSTPSPRPDGL